MKCDIVLAGVGGQGVLSIAAVLAEAASKAGLFVRQSEVHGMAQRGGAVSSHLRLGGEPIACDLIPRGKADIILSMEILEALRYTEFLSEAGIIITADETVVNIDNYPPVENIKAALQSAPSVRIIESGQLAREAGNARAVNMVMAGAASVFLPDIAPEIFEKVVASIFAKRSPETNIAAFRLGRAC